MSHAILRADRERKISDIYLHLSLGGVGTFGRRIPLHRKYLIYLQRSSIARNNFPADKVFSWWVRTSDVLCNASNGTPKEVILAWQRQIQQNENRVQVLRYIKRETGDGEK